MLLPQRTLASKGGERYLFWKSCKGGAREAVRGEYASNLEIGPYPWRMRSLATGFFNIRPQTLGILEIGPYP